MKNLCRKFAPKGNSRLSFNLVNNPKQYVLVCHPYVIRMYSYVIRMSSVCHSYGLMSSLCHLYAIRMSHVCHLYDTRMYLYFRWNRVSG